MEKTNPKTKNMAHQIFPIFSFTTVGNKTAKSPFDCSGKEPIHFAIRNAIPNSYHEIKIPINTTPTGEIAYIIDFILTDAQGNFDYFFNNGTCLLWNGTPMFSGQTDNHWKLNAGTYDVFLRWFPSQVPLGKTQIIVTN